MGAGGQRAGLTHHVNCVVIIWREKEEGERKITGRWVQVTVGVYIGPVWCVEEVWLCLRLESWWSWVRLTLSGTLLGVLIKAQSPER